MIKTDVYNLKKEVVGSIELSDAIFANRVSETLVHQIIKAQLAGVRQGTAASKTKGLVRGGGKKPFKQKGTGSARQGSSRSPLQPGGGSNFGPQPRSYKQDTPKKMTKGALRSVLSDKFANNRLTVIDKFDLSAAKTKVLDSVLKKAFNVKNVVLVDVNNESLHRATKNIPTARFLSVNNVNVYDLVKHEWLFVSKAALEQLTKQLSK